MQVVPPLARLPMPSADTQPGAFADRSPPYSAEAEISVLGGMLIDVDALAKAVEVIDDSMFYPEKHRRLYRAMVRLWERGEAIDPVTLSDELRNVGDFEVTGGMQYIATLLDAVPTAANIEYHAKIVREKAVLRRLIEAATGIIQETYANQGDVDQLLDRAESSIFQIAQTHERKGFVWIKELLWPAMEQIELMSQNASSITGVPTGFQDLDNMTAGFQKGDLIIVAARPSMGKCLAHDVEIVLDDGSVSTIEHVYRERAGRLLTLGRDWRFRTTEPSAFVDDGMKPVFRVTTRLGRAVEATLPHPFLTVDGWKRLEELSVGQHVAVPRRIDVFGRDAMRECEVKLLGYLLGDGGLTDTVPEFTNADPRLRDDFAAAVAEFGGVSVCAGRGGARTPSLRVRHDAETRSAGRAAFAEGLGTALAGSGRSRRSVAEAVGVSPASVTHWAGGSTVPDEETFAGLCAVLGVDPATIASDGVRDLRRHERNPVTRWLDELGLWGRGSHHKFVPAPVFRLPRPQLALFLNRLFATDGWATVLASGQAHIGYASVSERLARQVQHLLLRFGIIASLRRRSVKYRDGRRAAWQMDVTDSLAIRTFAAEIGMFGKEAALARAADVAAGKRYQTNRDLVPVEVWKRVEQAKGAESWASLARRAGIAGWSNLHVGKRAPTRARLAALAQALGDAELRAMAGGDVYWDEIVSIEPMGLKQVYDLTIPETHNFVANDVCVHNTAFTLNIAQHAAISAKKAVAFFSLEMSKESLVQRMLTSEARVDASRVRTGRLRDDDYPRLGVAAGLLNTAPIFVDDTAGISILEMRAKARRLKSDRADLAMIIVDYLQLMQGNGRTENRQQEVSEISRGLKALAKELEVPVVALSQLSRAVESRPDKRPMMSDLRESGAIEQDADLIMFLFRPEYYYGPTDKEGNSLEGRAEVIIGKQRNGATGTIPLMFQKEFTRFESFSPRTDAPDY
ncbi:MAG: replicative helicase [Gemmatimonadetes bacterium]|nr:replicative helicase [Gemmatimonadota bacterium]